MLAFVQPARALAQAPERLQLLVGYSAVHESNLFRLPDSVDPRSIGLAARSDTVHSGYVGLRLDQPYSLQRFQFDVTQTAYRHEDLSQLDFDALAYRGAWLWHLTPHVNGVLSADHNETAVPFSDFLGTERNVRKVDNRTFTVNGALLGGWHLLLGAGSSRQTSSVPVLAEADFESTRAEIGARYLARSGSSWGVTQRVSEGDYLNRALVPGSTLDSGFSERQTELQVSWLVTARSTLDARAFWLDRQHPNLEDRDFTALAGNMAYVWKPTGKLQVGVTAVRDVFASQDPLARYTRRQSLAIAPVWQAAAKVAVSLQLERSHTDYRNAGPSGPAREDNTDTGVLGVSWAATRNIALNASLQREERSSNVPGLDYRATVTRFAASLTF